MKALILLTAAAASLLSVSCQHGPGLHAHEQYLVVGTTDNYGLYVCALDTLTGHTRMIDSIEVVNPTYACLSADGNRLYTVIETGDSTAGAAAFAFDRLTGHPTLLNAVSGLGGNPCHIATDGKEITTAEYLGGSLTRYALTADGKFGEQLSHRVYDPKSHIHSSQYAPDGRQYVADLGCDFIYVQQEGVPQDTIRFEAGFGPRHFVFDQSRKHLYVIGELSGKVAVTERQGEHYVPVQYIITDTVPNAGTKGSADIHLSPDGRFLYASNRLHHDGLSLYSVGGNGLLTLCAYTPTGIHPRNFTLTAGGDWIIVACRDSNRIEFYRRSAQTGALTPHPELNRTFQKPMFVGLLPQ